MDELIKSLEKQAEMYRRIDAGTGYGYDKDANNIEHAIFLLKAYRKAWRRIKRAIPTRCSHVDVTHMYMAKVIEKDLTKDIEDIEKSILRIEQDEQIY